MHPVAARYTTLEYSAPGSPLGMADSVAQPARYAEVLRRHGNLDEMIDVVADGVKHGLLRVGRRLVLRVGAPGIYRAAYTVSTTCDARRSRRRRRGHHERTPQHAHGMNEDGACNVRVDDPVHVEVQVVAQALAFAERAKVLHNSGIFERQPPAQSNLLNSTTIGGQDAPGLA